GPAEVVDLLVLALGQHAADRLRADEEPVLVVLDAAVVEVRVEADLGRVAGEKEVLPEQVRDEDLLVAEVERVQPAVRVLLDLVEEREVVLPAVVVPVAEQAYARLVVTEQKPLEVADES